MATGYIIGMNRPWLTVPAIPEPKKAPSYNFFSTAKGEVTLTWSSVILSIVRLIESPVEILVIFPFSSNLISALKKHTPSEFLILGINGTLRRNRAAMECCRRDHPIRDFYVSSTFFDGFLV